MNQEIIKAKKMLDNSDAILISASNGLSIAEGYNIFADDENFRKYFNEFKSLYGISSLIQGVFAQIPQTDHQVFMHKVHQLMIDDYQPNQTFGNLKNILHQKDYFVVTSNADTHFQLNGFDPDKIFEVEGNFDGLEIKSVAWEKQQTRFEKFITDYKDKKVVQLELGIGANNKMIKLPLMSLVSQDKLVLHYVKYVQRN
ncbi:hypothetical protein [Companilactobacillus halodurans]|uniref:hypothetical protein n=1 Tax=Companilactobacillus halodurans TaxID=2584183 RepID=UPI001EE1FA03|nr:hypothetical protein [Companilactobacillus halodurans]